jgi:CHAT domain-containing protein
LLEYVRYPSPDLASAFGLPVDQRWNYAVAILRRDAPPACPAWRDLGPASPIERATQALRTSVDDAIEAGKQGRSVDPGPIRAEARRLYELLIQPMLPDLTTVDTLAIAPDGLLHLLPFAALQRRDGRYLAQEFKLFGVDSARDFSPPARSSGGPPVIFAAPDFGLQPTTVCGRRGTWGALPGALTEATTVAASLPGAQTFVGKGATKAALFEVKGPTILHIATHGYFCESATGGGAFSASLDDPLLRAGLVFSGANRPAPDSAGSIATAVEVAKLDLHGTSLVVLSACETGLGDIAVGEGVLGMRRALAEAGAESEVLTLWEVGFDAPETFMRVFYDALKRGESRLDAFHGAQLQLIGDPRFAEPYLWAGFTLYGQPGPVALRRSN